MEETKYCKHCGERIPADAIICTKCGRQVEKIETNHEGITINNVASANAAASAEAHPSTGRMVNKWTSLILCIVLGWLGGHKFYEGKTGLGILYLLTGGLFLVGWIIDIFVILAKPDPYYVH